MDFRLANRRRESAATGRGGSGTARVNTILVTVCMVLIAGSGAVLLYLHFGFTGPNRC